VKGKSKKKRTLILLMQRIYTDLLINSDVKNRDHMTLLWGPG